MLGWNQGSLSKSSGAAESLRIESEVKQLNDSIFELHMPQGGPNLEFVFFHGLYLGISNDQYPYLWTWESGDGTCIWPQTWLVDEFPGARIIFVSYGGKVGKWCHGSRDMYIVGENLAFDMMEANIGQTPDCPVILVGHCFGGLVLKQLCLQVNVKKGLTRDEGERTKLEKFLGNIKRIFYYGTPHYGNPMIDKVTDVFKDPLLSYFKTLSTEGSRLNSDFDQLCKVYPEWRAHSLGESLPSESGLFKGVVAAPEASARQGDFNLLATEHTAICKPKSKTDMRFYALRNLVKSIDSNFEDLSLPVHQCKGLPSYPADLERRAKEVEEKLKGVFFLGLVGMGGIGKTTLAKQVFNNISGQFEYTCFVDNVKGIESHTLEERLLSTLHHKGKSLGKQIDWWQLKGKRTLIVMDDLNSSTQLKLLEPQSFGIGSHAILTTRDRGVLDAVGNRKMMNIYDVQFLAMEDAKKLFCQHAGIEEITDDAFENNNLKEKVEAVVEKCGGLPLTLEVMGSYLRDHVTNASFWKETIDKLVTGQPICGGRDDGVWASLRISYNALVQEEQEIFTEAATLFLEEPVDRALAAWSSAYGNSETRWENLVRKSLAKETLKWVRHGKHVGECKTVWVHEQLRGLAMSFRKGDRVSKQIWESNEMVDLFNAKKVKAEAKFLSLSSPLSEKSVIQVDQLARLQRLKYLELIDFVLKGSAKNFPRELLILSLTSWVSHHTRFHLPPINLKEMNNLALLELEDCNIPEKLLEELENLDKLRILSFTNVHVINKLHIFSLANFQSSVIRRLPETFGNLSRLKDLKLVDQNLEELPKSFGNLSALEHLELRGLNCLELPESFVELASLQSLTIAAFRLRCLPESIGRLSSLRRLTMLGDGIENLPSSLGLLFALQYLAISCTNLENLPESFGNLSSLEDLKLHSNRLKTLPENFGRLHLLRRLELDAKMMSELPNSFGELSRMQDLKMTCANMEKLPDSFGNLFSLEDLSLDLRRLETLPENFGRLNSLRQLRLVAEISDLPNSFGGLSKMQDLTLHCENLVKLPDGFGNLSSLKRVVLHTRSLESLPNSFGNLSSLETFVICQDSLKSFPESVGQLSSLRELQFNCDGHEHMPDGLAHLSFFSHSLTLTGYEPQILPGGLAVLCSLRTLSIKSLGKLESLPEELGELSSLQRLDITNSHILESLPGSLARISSLKDVHISGCGTLKNLPDSWGKPSSLPQGDGRQDLKRSAVGESSSMTADSEGMRVHVSFCRSLDESLMTILGWLLEPRDDPVVKRYRRRKPVGLDWVIGNHHLHPSRKLHQVHKWSRLEKTSFKMLDSTTYVD